MSVLPITLELGCEITFPIKEATPTGILISSGQIFGIILTFIVNNLLMKKEYSIILWIFSGCFGISFFLFIFFFHSLKRLELEKII